MKKWLMKYSGIFSVVCYLFVMFHIADWCWEGLGVLHLPAIIFGIVGFVCSLSLYIYRKVGSFKENSSVKPNRKIAVFALVGIVFGTLYTGGKIIYSALPHHGELSYYLDEKLNSRDYKLHHKNFFETGFQGILEDLQAVEDFPETLYIEDDCTISIKSDGTIESFHMNLQGTKSGQEAKRYMIRYYSYEDKIHVRKDSYIDKSWGEEYSLKYMQEILDHSSLEQLVQEWNEYYGSCTYELEYHGREILLTSENVSLVNEDKEKEVEQKEDQVLEGYALFVRPDHYNTTEGKWYVSEPQYKTQEEYAKMLEKEQKRKSIMRDAIVNLSDGSMTYKDYKTKTQWKVVPKDKDEGAGEYEFFRCKKDGAWEKVNDNIFGKEKGALEGIFFQDGDIGYIGLADPLWKSSKIFYTKDGGETFKEMVLPVVAENHLSHDRQRYGITTKDFRYAQMPHELNDGILLQMEPDVLHETGPVYYTEDFGKTWEYRY